MKDKFKGVGGAERNVTLVSFGLLGEWVCYPVDLLPEEKVLIVKTLRDNLGQDFTHCPLEYIEDRLFGGFHCSNDPGRRHAYFATGHFGFMAAAQGRYWSLNSNDRAELWVTLLEKNEGDPNPGDGPFTDDYPKT